MTIRCEKVGVLHTKWLEDKELCVKVGVLHTACHRRSGCSVATSDAHRFAKFVSILEINRHSDTKYQNLCSAVAAK